MDKDLLKLDAFEIARPRLRAVAYRMLGSLAEADDAVQEAWLRLDHADVSAVENLPGWLTTVVSRVCLKLLRSRENRREDSIEFYTADWLGNADEGLVPEEEAELADSVGLALLVVMNTLSPAERIAFVLHDMFDVGFDDIARMMERNVAAVRQLASRARKRVKGTVTSIETASVAADAARQLQAVQAYLAATRTGNFEALLILLDPDVVLHADGAAVGGTTVLTLQGALTVAKAALAAATRAKYTVGAFVDGTPALVMAPIGRLALVIRFEHTDRLISSIDVIAQGERLRELEIRAG